MFKDKLAAQRALELTWWASELKRTWKLEDGKRVYYWELV